MPGSIPPDYSRGHPLFFHFLCSLWIRIFGSSNIAVHSFPLFLSVIFLVSVYEGCLNLFGKREAILALLLIISQVLFFVQSSFVVPEIMLAMFAFLSLYFYAKDRLLLTSLMLFMLFFTKEGGMVFGVAIMLHVFISLFLMKEGILRKIQRLATVLIPGLLIGIFFLLQKAKMGWYLLPYHSSLIHTDWNSLYGMFRVVLDVTVTGDFSRCILILFIILLSLFAAIKRKDIRYLFLCLPAIITYILTNKSITDNTGDTIWIVLFVLFFSAPLYYVLTLNKTIHQPARRFILLLGISFGGYLCFSSLSQLTYRYLLVVVVMLLIFLAVCINIFATAGGKHIFSVAVAGILIIGAYGFYADEGTDDTDLQAFHAMKVQKDVVFFLEKENAYDKEISAGCFWELTHFKDTMEGFLSSSRIFYRLNWDSAGPITQYAVFDNICGDYRYERMVKNPDFRLAYKTSDGKIWAEVYKRR